MPINITGAAAAPLSVFGGWVTEVSPESVPENCSPDCSDVVFAPGEVGSRPALEANLASPFPPGGPDDLVPTVVYSKSYKMPTGQIKNLYLDSNGVLWSIDLTSGARTQLLQSAPGSYARSVTHDGREYIAISDGLHGTEVPLQFDGVNLDRVTQNGPGAPPTVTCFSLPGVAMANATALTAPIASIQAIASHVVGGTTFYAYLLVTITGSFPGFTIGQSVTITGSGIGAFDVTGTIGGTGTGIGVTTITVTYNQTTGGTAAGGTVSTGAAALVRSQNTVTASTAAPHGLLVGYQAQIANTQTTPIGGGIQSIVLDNENLPGIATVTTTSVHGLIPNLEVTITGVSPAIVGGTITAAVRQGDTVTITTSADHGLIPGAVAQIAGVTDVTFDTTTTIALVPAPNQLVYSQVDTDASSSGGMVAITWPIPDNTPTPTYFSVVSVPSPTTFQIQVTYSNGTWGAGGAVSFPWDGIFYVSAVLSPTLFQYKNYGPNAVYMSTGGETVTPFGQIAPGIHLMQELFISRQGAIYAPSPPVTFVANGGQYVSVGDLSIGPANIAGRILQFTGAQPNVPGSLPPFFYIPTIPQLEGQIVGTATQINDNTTTSVILDFADNTLYAAIGTSVPGNTLANQIVIEGALGFGAYESRLTTWGQRNTVDNLLNMGFDGGYSILNPTIPLGWTYPGTNGSGSLVPTTPVAGFAWDMVDDGSGNPCGQLIQSAYEDAYGVPIVQGGTSYSFRCRLDWNPSSPNNGNIKAQLFDTGQDEIVTIAVPAGGLGFGYFQVDFGTLVTVRPAMIFSIWLEGAPAATHVRIDEMSLIFQETPYRDTLAYASYVNNPEGIDGFTGQYGAQDDPAKLMDQAILNDTLYLITRAPSGRIHQTNGSAVNEPNGWSIDEVAANCGTLSAFGLTHSQADDTAASGGDDWMAWPSEGGVNIFSGGQPEKISQEIQPNWNDPSRADTTIQINMDAATTIWGLNDPVQRLLMFGVPIGTATAPSKVYVLNYRNLGNAAAIAGSPPFHPSFSGKIVATDNARKWAPWNMSINSAARIYLQPGKLSLVLCGGNGLTAGSEVGFGNTYILNPAKFTDDDYGQIFPFYDTYFFLDAEKAQFLKLKGGRIMLAYLRAYIQGVGTVRTTYYPDSLANPWAISITRDLDVAFFEREFGGAYCTGDRIAIKISSEPLADTTDNAFTLSTLTAWFRDSKMVIRGAAR